MIRNHLHQQVLSLLRQTSDMDTPDREGFAIKYVGSDKLWYHLPTGETKKIAQSILKEFKPTLLELTNLINSLYLNGQSFEEISIAARLVALSSKLRQTFDINLLDSWLSHVHGWAETDVLCQMAFTDTDLLTRWSDWKKLLIKFNSDPNVHKRRASIVLLTKPVRLSPDVRLADLAFANTEKLKTEKDILITKAVSWILRSLIAYHPQRVGEYLNANQDSLPRIAYREATNKLLTGKKYIRPKTS